MIIKLIPRFVRQLLFSLIEEEINEIDVQDVDQAKAFILTGLVRILRL